MSASLPDLEPVWVVEATYAPNAAQRRPQFRAEHLMRLVALKAEGTVIEAGAYADLSGSLVLVRAESADAALGLFRSDVYITNGIWTELRARGFGRVV